MSTHNLCFEWKYEKYQIFFFENFHFLVVKFSVHLNRRVFVMTVDHQWLNHLWGHGNSFQTWGVQTTEGRARSESKWGEFTDVFSNDYIGGGRVVRRCCVSYITGASS